jgi:hypothetical protein
MPKAPNMASVMVKKEGGLLLPLWLHGALHDASEQFGWACTHAHTLTVEVVAALTCSLTR